MEKNWRDKNIRWFFGVWNFSGKFRLREKKEEKEKWR